MLVSATQTTVREHGTTHRSTQMIHPTYAYTHTHPHTQRQTHTHQHGQLPSLGKWHTIRTRAHAHGYIVHFSTRADTSTTCTKQKPRSLNWALPCPRRMAQKTPSHLLGRRSPRRTNKTATPPARCEASTTETDDPGEAKATRTHECMSDCY